MIDVLPALAAALIWAYASVSYRGYVEKLGVFKLNALRMFYASLALLIPALYLGLGRGAVYAALSGVLSLALGDSLYLKALRTAGVSLAVPAAYSYVILEQFIAVLLGEPLKAAYLAAAGLTVAGVYLLVAGHDRGSLGGILYALGAAAAWSAGYAAVKVAGVGGLSPISVAFVRVAAALPVLASRRIWGRQGDEVHLEDRPARDSGAGPRGRLRPIRLLGRRGGPRPYGHSAGRDAHSVSAHVEGSGQREADGEGVLGRRVDPSGHSHIVYIAWIRPARVDREAL